jgi:hypothetical protein
MHKATKASVTTAKLNDAFERINCSSDRLFKSIEAVSVMNEVAAAA